MPETPRDAPHPHAAHATRLSAETTQEILDSAPVGLLLYQDGRVIYANEAACKMLGQTIEELMSLTQEQVRSIIWEEDRPAVMKTMDALAGGEVVPPVTHRVRTADGSPLWVDGYASTLLIDGRSANRVLFFDVSGRYAIEKDLEASATLLKGITDSAIDSIFCKDIELRYTFANKAICELLGCTLEQLIGKRPEEVFGEADGKIVRDVDNRCLGGEEVSAIRALSIDGKEHTFHTIQVPMKDVSGKAIGIAGIVRDVTDEANTRQELAESKERYRQLVEASPNGIAVHAEGKVVFANSEAVRLLGASGPEELLGLDWKREWSELMAPLSGLRPHLDRLLKTADPLPRLYSGMPQHAKKRKQQMPC